MIRWCDAIAVYTNKTNRDDIADFYHIQFINEYRKDLNFDTNDISSKYMPMWCFPRLQSSIHPCCNVTRQHDLIYITANFNEQATNDLRYKENFVKIWKLYLPLELEKDAVSKSH